MIALGQPDFFAEHAWLIGEEEEPTGLSPSARHLRETRIMAAVFKRRWRLIVQWRSQQPETAGDQASTTLSGSERATADGDVGISTDLPRLLPILREELALLRAFISEEIDAILFGT